MKTPEQWIKEFHKTTVVLSPEWLAEIQSDARADLLAEIEALKRELEQANCDLHRQHNYDELKRAQLCPVCQGHGIVDAGFYQCTTSVLQWSGTCSNTEKCRACEGKGILR